jgi:hypothetical protein
MNNLRLIITLMPIIIEILERINNLQEEYEKQKEISK